MNDWMDKGQLLSEIVSARAKLEKTLSEIPPDRLTVPGVESDWTLKDLMAHISVWERRMTEWLDVTLRDEQPGMLPAGMTWDDLDRWNEQTYFELRDKPLEEVLTEFTASYEQALAAVQRTPQDALADPDRYPWRKGVPLWEMVAANMHWHYDEHEQSIRTWLEQSERP